MKTLSIIIAVYNEKDSILKVLERINKVETGLKKEIIIIDGCSTDGTREILKQIKADNIKIILEDKRNGKGYALRQGFTKVSGDIILIQDADLEIDPFDYPELLKPILEDSYKVVYGSRFLKGRGNTNMVSYFGNRLVTMAANILFNTRLTDMETCYKVFEADVIKGVEFSCNGFDFDAEFTCGILKKRIPIKEVPITYNPRGKSEGKKLHWTVALPSLAVILKRRFK